MNVVLSKKTLFFAKSLFNSNKCLPQSFCFNNSKNFSVTPRNNVQLVQFTYYNQPGYLRAGYIDGTGYNVVDLNALDPCIPCTLLDVIWNGDIDKVKRMKLRQLPSVNLSCVRLEAPITGQDKVLSVGLNYQCHCSMHNVKAPPVPMIFSKFTSSVIGPYDCLTLRTGATQKVDWEVELAVVIGKEASCVKAAEALDYVLGYTIAQDISARDWQKERNAGQFLLGKSMDTFCPIGPWIVTSDEIGDAQKLDISCCVNGQLKQNSNTCQLVHKIPDVIERLTSVMTLYPGDIILTGTPGGVGMYLNPPQFLQPGDVITSSIQNIGTLETRVRKYIKP